MLSKRDIIALVGIIGINFWFFPSELWYFWILPISMLALLIWIVILLKRCCQPKKQEGPCCG